MKQSKFIMSLAMAALAMPLSGYAALVLQTSDSTGPTDDWNTAANWGGTTVTSADDFQSVAGLRGSVDTKLGVSITTILRSYPVSSSGTFLGGSLTLVPSTELLIKEGGTSTANLILNGGVARLSGNTGTVGSLDGSIDVAAESYLGVVQSAASTLTVNSTLTGSSLLHLAAGDGNGNTLIFAGTLSGYAGTLDVGGGTGLLTLDFNQDYNLSSADMKMGDYATADVLNLDQTITVNSFSFGGSVLGAGTYSASDLNTLFGSGSQFVDGGGSLTTVIPEPATLGLVGVFGAGVLFIRRRFMI